MAQSRSLQEAISCNLIFVGGKGGVGKTSVSLALAQRLADCGKRTLWITIEDPLRPPGERKPLGPRLTSYNCDAGLAFQEYIGLKIGLPGLTNLFLKNNVIQYLAKASPGIHELVLLGKIWHERTEWDHIVVDLPATGHGLAMFQSTRNFSRLFRGGPLHDDAEAMNRTFEDPKACAHLIVALPEEMPLQEALELEQYLLKLYPNNSPTFLINKCFPDLSEAAAGRIPVNPDDWETPVPGSASDYVLRRSTLERFHLDRWRDEKRNFETLPFLALGLTSQHTEAASALSQWMELRGLGR